MNEVKVKREELLTKVRANRDALRSLFLLAQEVYRKLVIEWSKFALSANTFYAAEAPRPPTQ
jgi:hypothetical protein